MNDDPIKSFRVARRLTLGQLGAMFTPPVDKSTVLRWQDKVPAERVIEIERVTGIPRNKLRPDLYPAEEAA